MTIKGLLTWKNPDSTRDLNAVWGTMQKGVYEGGTFTASSTNLTVTVDPFIAKSKDGMTVVSDNPEVVTLTAGTTQYLVLFAKYEIPTPTLQLQLVSAATWASSVNKDYFVTFAKFVTPALATAATSATITYDSGEYSDKLGKSPWRASVANFAALPTTGNRNGDARITLDTFTIYVWDALTLSWGALNTTSNLSEIGARKPLESMVEKLALSTSGLMGGVLNSNTTHSTLPTHDGIALALIEQPSANQLGFGAMHAYVHGHFIKRHAEVLTLPTAPGVGTRYDLVYLEVWQETLTTALGVGYENDSLGTDTLAQVLAHFNQALEDEFSPNHTIEAIDLVDPTTLIITKSSLRVQASVSSASISTPTVGMSGTVNQFGNSYSQNSDSDRFAYTANAPAVYSTRTWAIPLLVLKRRATEGTFVVFDTVTFDRYAFDIAPRATLGKALTDVIDTLAEASQEALAGNVEYPSGFLHGVRTRPLQIGGSVPTGKIRVPDMVARVMNNKFTIPSTDVTLPAIPTTGGRRDVAYIEFYLAAAATRSTDISLGVSQIISATYQGARTYSWFARFVAASVGTCTDESDSMAYAGFTPQASDAALWYRTATDDEPAVFGRIFALPVAIAHRRNSGLWDVATNPNGHYVRPDSAVLPATTTIHPRELVDLRREVISPSDVASVIDDSFNKLTTGQLRTALKQHPHSADVYGTSAMVTTVTSAAPVTGKHVMTPVPNAANAHTVWSDSDELIPISYTVEDLTVADTSPDGVFYWNGGGDAGAFAITAPTGMYILTTNTVVSGPYTYQNDYDAANTEPTIDHCFALQFDSVSGGTTNSPNPGSPILISVLTGDSLGNATGLGVASLDWVTAAPADAKLHVTVWFVKPTKTKAVDYVANQSLFGSPTQVYSATVGGSPVNVGPITATINTTVTGTTFSITQADVFAARPDIASGSGAIRLFGLAGIKAQGAQVKLRYVNFTDATSTNPEFLRLDVELASALPANTPVELTVMCDGDLINEWIEVVSESRQVRGLYRYVHTDSTAWTSALGTVGYFGQWYDRNGGSPLNMQPVSIMDTSLSGVYGVQCGKTYKSNTRSSQVDHVVCADSGGNAFVAWYRSADTVGLGFPVDQFLHGNFLTATKGVVGVDTNTTDTLANQSPYSIVPMSTPLDVVSIPTANMMFVGVAQLPPTNTLELTYEVPAYQGMTSPTLLASNLRGNLAYVAPTVVTTEGANASFLHPAVAASAHEQMIGSSLFSGIAVGASTYRAPESMSVDANSALSKGTVVSRVRSRARTRVSMMRQLPYPSAPVTAGADRYAPEQSLYHSAVSSRPLSRTVVKYLSGTTGVFSRLNDLSYDDVGSLAQGNLITLTQGGFSRWWTFDIPTGAVLKSVRLYGTNVDAINGDIDVVLRLLSSVNYQIDGYDPIIAQRLTYSTTANEAFVVNINPVQTGCVGYNYQALTGATRFSLGMKIVSDLVLTFSAVEITYTEWVDPVYGSSPTIPGAASTSIFRPELGLEQLQVSMEASTPSSSMVLHSGGLAGATIEPPAAWSPTQLTQLESAVFAPGASDYAGDWARGMTSSVSNATNTYYESGLLGFVPLSGTALRTVDDMSAIIPDITVEPPALLDTPTAPVNTAALDTIFDTISVATVTSYGMVNADHALTLGVSVGVIPNTMSPLPYGTRLGWYTNVHNVQVGGSTIDGFYPVGRPIVEPK